MAEFKFKTKYFGNIIIDVDSDGHGDTDVMYEDKEINIFLSEYSLYGDKVKVCLEIIDRYIELNEIAKKAMLENFTENKTINYYFECHFDALEKEDLMEIFGVDEFQKMDIKKVIERLEYPNLLFSIENGEIKVSVDYKISEAYSDEILCVKIDEKLNVIDFSHES